jgi:hypothetical protein
MRVLTSMAQSPRRWWVAADLPEKVIRQIKNARLPVGGSHPFAPKLKTNPRGHLIIDKKAPSQGPKAGEIGFVDDQGRIWIRDLAHAGLPEHWDVQIDDGADYIRIGYDGEEIT